MALAAARLKSHQLFHYLVFIPSPVPGFRFKLSLCIYRGRSVQHPDASRPISRDYPLTEPEFQFIRR